LLLLVHVHGYPVGDTYLGINIISGEDVAIKLESVSYVSMAHVAQLERVLDNGYLDVVFCSELKA
jgi:hypothetical protein